MAGKMALTKVWHAYLTGFNNDHRRRYPLYGLDLFVDSLSPLNPLASLPTGIVEPWKFFTLQQPGLASPEAIFSANQGVRFLSARNRRVWLHATLGDIAQGSCHLSSLMEKLLYSMYSLLVGKITLINQLALLDYISIQSLFSGLSSWSRTASWRYTFYLLFCAPSSTYPWSSQWRPSLRCAVLYFPGAFRAYICDFSGQALLCLLPLPLPRIKGDPRSWISSSFWLLV